MSTEQPTAPALGPEAFRLDGLVAFVTGATGLLGSQHIRALAANGAAIVVTDRDADHCETRASELRATGARAVATRCDVSRKESWEEALKIGLAEFGQIDILLNNAAFTSDSRSSNYGAGFLEFPLEDWSQIMAVNLTGMYLGCQSVGRHMVKRRRGSIINVSSLYGLVSPHHTIYEGTGVSQPVAYSVSKAGVLALTRYLATLWASQGVRVNALTPGGVFNGQHPDFVKRYADLSPMGRMANRDEMSGAVVFLASAASAYCTGLNLVVDGGWTAW